MNSDNLLEKNYVKLKKKSIFARNAKMYKIKKLGKSTRVKSGPIGCNYGVVDWSFGLLNVVDNSQVVTQWIAYGTD